MQTTPSGRGLGWHPSLPDVRDHVLRITAPTALPPTSDLRPGMPPIKDQGQLGSCTAFASTAAWVFELMRQGKPVMDCSELSEYYWSRSLEGTTRSDAGATIRDAVKVLAKTGAAPENLWPYTISKFRTAPPASVKKAAAQHLALEYQSVPQTADAIKAALASGLPVIIGISVYQSFESPSADKTGVIPMPTTREQLLGGHAVLLVGHDDATRRFTFRNSWSPSWGDAGYGYLPYDYVTNPNLGGDYWVVKSVEAA